MSESRKVFIFGYSGHSYVVIESLLNAGYEVKGYFDLEPNLDNPFNINYCGEENRDTIHGIIEDNLVFPAVGSNFLRKKIIKFFKENKLNEFIAIDPSSNISKTAVIGLSSYVGRNAIINSFANIGSGVIINSASIIEHECIIHDYSHIAPNATLCGNVKVGENSFIGASSVIRENIKICGNTILGAGSTLVSSIKEEGVYMGIPAKKYEW